MALELRPGWSGNNFSLKDITSLGNFMFLFNLYTYREICKPRIQGHRTFFDVSMLFRIFGTSFDVFSTRQKLVETVHLRGGVNFLSKMLRARPFARCLCCVDTLKCRFYHVTTLFCVEQSVPKTGSDSDAAFVGR